MNATVRERLHHLADHLDPALARELRDLIAADSRPVKVLELEGRTQRAEDLAAEAVRQLRGLERAYARLEERQQVRSSEGDAGS